MKKTLHSLLKKKFTQEEYSLIPKSFDIVGDILIFNEVPKELRKKEKILGEALLAMHPNLKAIAKKTKIHSGLYRLKKIKIIAGEKRKVTLHKENGISLKLHVETCYFSPRLGNERLRIAKLVKKNESILVLFSGIAPFPLVIARNSKAKKIIGIEINPEAHKYALENIQTNKTKNIDLRKGNVKSIIPLLKEKFDRIIMPSPKTGKNYLYLLKKIIKKNTVIHFYDFSHEKNFPDSSIKKIKKVFPKIKVLKVIKCGQYSPHSFRVCIDFKILS